MMRLSRNSLGWCDLRPCLCLPRLGKLPRLVRRHLCTSLLRRMWRSHRASSWRPLLSSSHASEFVVGASAPLVAPLGGLVTRQQQLDLAQGTVEHRHCASSWLDPVQSTIKNGQGTSSWVDPPQSTIEHGQGTNSWLDPAQGAIEEFPTATGSAWSHIFEPNNHVSGNVGERAKVKDEEWEQRCEGFTRESSDAAVGVPRMALDGRRAWRLLWGQTKLKAKSWVLIFLDKLSLGPWNSLRDHPRN